MSAKGAIRKIDEQFAGKAIARGIQRDRDDWGGLEILDVLVLGERADEPGAIAVILAQYIPTLDTVVAVPFNVTLEALRAFQEKGQSN